MPTELEPLAHRVVEMLMATDNPEASVDELLGLDRDELEVYLHRTLMAVSSSPQPLRAVAEAITATLALGREVGLEQAFEARGDGTDHIPEAPA